VPSDRRQKKEDGNFGVRGVMVDNFKKIVVSLVLILKCNFKTARMPKRNTGSPLKRALHNANRGSKQED
jgi:hypothetical protein